MSLVVVFVVIVLLFKILQIPFVLKWLALLKYFFATLYLLVVKHKFYVL